MEVRGGADHDGLDFRVAQDDVRVLGQAGNPQALEELHSLLAHIGIGDSLDLHLRDKLRDVLRVDPANPPRSNDADLNGFHNPLS